MSRDTSTPTAKSATTESTSDGISERGAEQVRHQRDQRADAKARKLETAAVTGDGRS